MKTEYGYNNCLCTATIVRKAMRKEGYSLRHIKKHLARLFNNKPGKYELGDEWGWAISITID
jgi:hypothetical protein